MDKPIIIRNRPLEHYVLSVFSLLVQNKKKIILKGYGSLIAKTLDLVNLITDDIIPNTFDKKFQHGIEKVTVGDNTFKTSVLTAVLKVK